MAAVSSSESDGCGDSLRLPPEISNEIYHLALKIEKSIEIARHQGPKEMRRSGQIYKNSVSGKFTVKSTIVPRPGKKHGKVSACHVLATGLLRASKALHQEAVAMIYHDNEFLFTTPEAVHEFTHMIGSNVKSPAYLKVMSDVSRDVDFRHIFGLRKATNIKSIGIAPLNGDTFRRRNTVGAFYTTKNSDLAARLTWNAISPIVAYREVDSPKCKQLVRLLESEQVRRLAAFEFEVLDWMLFEVEGAEDVRIASEDERRRRFDGLLRNLLHEEFVRDGGSV